MNILETYYTYGKLPQAAYIDLSPASINNGNPYDAGTIVQAGVNQERVSEFLAKNIFGSVTTDADTWTMLSPYYKTGGVTGHSDPASGFAGMLMCNTSTAAIAEPAVCGKADSNPARCRKRNTCSLVCATSN